MSFLTLGIFWVGQQSQLNHLRRCDIRLTWIHLAFLFAVTLMPFSTKLLGMYHPYRTAVLEYWGNILIFGAMLYASWGYATRAGLVKDDISPQGPAAVCRRIIIGQAWYAFGAVLCFFSTYLSMSSSPSNCSTFSGLGSALVTRKTPMPPSLPTIGSDSVKLHNSCRCSFSVPTAFRGRPRAQVLAGTSASGTSSDFPFSNCHFSDLLHPFRPPPGFLQRLPSFQQTLQARQNHGPSSRNHFDKLRSGTIHLMDYRQLHRLALLLDFVAHP